MSPTVELSQDTFKRLQAHAVPLVDTIESVVLRLIEAYEKKPTSAQDDGVRDFNPESPPDLTHAKILGVAFAGVQLGRNDDNWNGLLHHAVRAARKAAPSDDKFGVLMTANWVKGEKTNEGFRPVEGTDVSVQGQDANGAWRAASQVAFKLGVDLTAKFAWREKSGAAFPGLTGRMVIKGK